MQAYHDMLRFILENGEDRGDRTGVGTRSVFGYQARYLNVADNFPLDTTRALNFNNIVHELLWMLKGDTNIRYLAKNNVMIWHEWPLKNYNKNNPDKQMVRDEFNKRIVENKYFAEKWGECGPIYGKQWCNWYGLKEQEKGSGWQNTTIVRVNQIAMLVEDLKKNPLSRRHIVSAWNVADISAMIPSGLPPCHVLFQFYCSQLSPKNRWTSIAHADDFKRFDTLSVEQSEKLLNEANAPKYKLHCQLYQRSCDSVLGASYNIPSYSLLTMMLAQQVNMVAGDFIHSIGDAHIYSNHIEKLQRQLERKFYPAPTVRIRKAKDIFSYTIDDFELQDYASHPIISYPIAV